MSHKQKENIVSLITSLVVTIPYLIFIVNKYNNEKPSGQDELVFWASAILLLIPIRIVAQIIVYILFAIGRAIVTNNSEESEVTDERDQIIELKSNKNSYYTFAAAFIFSLLAAVLSQSITSMFMVMLIGGFISEIVECISKIYYYSKD